MFTTSAFAMVLVADDDPFMRSMLTRYLEREGYQVVEARNGQEALEKYFQYQPDLVLLDALMPVMDGFEVCQRLQQRVGNPATPILMITGLEDKESIDQAFEMGVIDYITKPIHWAVLRQRVQRLIQQYRLELQLRQMNQQLQRLAVIDGLTQVANRRRFEEYLLQEWRRSVREQTPLSVILCDIDHFKNYNDCYGHQAGDRCLQRVASVLTQCLHRSTDLVARYGGEEFILVLPATEISGAAAIAERIHHTLQQIAIPHEASPTAPIVTLSCGVTSLYPSAHSLPSDLVFAADQALYTAKNAGRNQSQTTTPIMAFQPSDDTTASPQKSSALMSR